MGRKTLKRKRKAEPARSPKLGPEWEPRLPLVGIDPGKAFTGMYCSKCNVALTATSNKELPDAARYQEILTQLRPHWHCAEIVIIEDTFGRFVKHTDRLIGALQVAFGTANFCLVPPGKWIKDLFGGAKGEYKRCAARLGTSVRPTLFTEPKTKKEAAFLQHAHDALSLTVWYDRCIDRRSE